MQRPEITVAGDALDRLYRFCERRRFQRHLLVADGNTHAVLGEKVEQGLQARGSEVRTVILAEKEVIADARHILKVLLSHDGAPCTFLAVGSGTITDITRFASHRTGNPFISLPTAPSVDGYTSTNVPLIVDGIKKSCTAHGPLAIFADTAVLCAAPRQMIAAGFGDMLGKYTSVADWRLGHILWDQPYDESIARRAIAAADICVEAVHAIGSAAPRGIARLMEALIESGFCMTDFGTSVPASGAEHHYSHFWEMKLLREGRPPILHGAKVGVATVLVAGLYDRIRGLSRVEVSRLLSASARPDREREVRRIEAAFGPMAGEIVSAQAAFLDMTSGRFERLKQDILDRWPDIQEAAARVPAAGRVAELLAGAGGPTSARALGLSDEEVAQAAGSAHYLRPHFTVRKLAQILFPGDRGLSG